MSSPFRGRGRAAGQRDGRGQGEAGVRDVQRCKPPPIAISPRGFTNIRRNFGIRLMATLK